MAHVAMLASVQTSLRSLYILVGAKLVETRCFLKMMLYKPVFSMKAVQRYSVSTLWVLLLLGLSAFDSTIGNQAGKLDK